MCAPGQQLHKHVLNSSGRPAGWVAQVPADGEQKTAGGIHEMLQAAAATAARVLKVPMQDMRLQLPWPCHQSAAAVISDVQQSSSPLAGRMKKGIKKVLAKPRYVYKQGTRFRVAVGADYVAGSFTTAAAAAIAAADYAKKHGLEQELKDQSRVEPGELLNRLKAGCEPPDLEMNQAGETQLSSSLWQSVPALAFHSALGEYGPWRANLRARAQPWSSPGKPPARPQDYLPSRTAGLLNVLKGTVVDNVQSAAWSLV